MARTKSINFPNTETELSTLFDKLQRSTVQELLLSGALAIHGASSPLAKTANTIYFMVDGQVYSKAASDMAALSGTVANATFNVFVFSVNSAGTLTTQMGTGATTLGGVVFPTVADGNITIGLDDGTVVPGAVYVNTLGDFFPFFQNL